MNNSALKDIQQALNIIRAEIEKVDAETKMAAKIAAIMPKVAATIPPPIPGPR